MPGGEPLWQGIIGVREVAKVDQSGRGLVEHSTEQVFTQNDCQVSTIFFGLNARDMATAEFQEFRCRE